MNRQTVYLNIGNHRTLLRQSSRFPHRHCGLAGEKYLFDWVTGSSSHRLMMRVSGEKVQYAEAWSKLLGDRKINSEMGRLRMINSFFHI